MFDVAIGIPFLKARTWIEAINLSRLIESLNRKFKVYSLLFALFLLPILLQNVLKLPVVLDEQPEVEDRSICYDVAFNPGEQLIPKKRI